MMNASGHVRRVLTGIATAMTTPGSMALAFRLFETAAGERWGAVVDESLNVSGTPKAV
mgnify:CR=1 FL=1